jgi:hypothetical protein
MHSFLILKTAISGLEQMRARLRVLRSEERAFVEELDRELAEHALRKIQGNE